jgi:chemotaxis protein CheD
MASNSSLPSTFDRGVVTAIHQGDCLVSDAEDVTFSTILGSCVSACVRDTVAGVGGMNHFLLAEQSDSFKEKFGATSRYGAFAMEQLINSVLSKGTGKKANLEIKIFGGGIISSRMHDVGAKNIAFVKNFLREEGYSIASEDVGGTWARRVMYKPSTGRALIKRLDSAAGASLAEQEIKLAVKKPAPAADDIELF